MMRSAHWREQVKVDPMHNYFMNLLHLIRILWMKLHRTHLKLGANKHNNTGNNKVALIEENVDSFMSYLAHIVKHLGRAM
jgi:hypothetical protein